MKVLKLDKRYRLENKNNPILEFYPQWERFSFFFSHGSDENPKFYLNTQLTTVIAFVLPFLFGVFFIPISLLLLYFGWGELFIWFPINAKNPEEFMDVGRWGFYNYGHETKFNIDDFWICWGKKYWVFNYPWSFVHYKHEVFLKNQTWQKYNENLEDQIFRLKYPYSYVLNNDEVQTTTATIYKTRREWRRKWLPFTSLFARKLTSIDVSFDHQIGEGAGSWKGGVLGCGYDMKKGETMGDTLRRMEIERKFN